MRITTMIRKKLFKTAVITMSVLTLVFGMTACGKKNNTATDNTASKTEAVSEDSKIEDVAESTEATKADIAAKDKEDTSGEVIVADNGSTGDTNVSDTPNESNEVNNGSSDSEVNTPADIVETPELPAQPDNNAPNTSDDNSGNDTGSSGTENSFYDDYMNGSHMAGDEDLIDKDSDPSKPCPHPLNTPIEGEYTGVNGDGVYGTYPVYIVYTLCSEDATGGKAADIVKDMYYGGKFFVNGELIAPYVSLPIGEYECGMVRASYVPRV